MLGRDAAETLFRPHHSKTGMALLHRRGRLCRPTVNAWPEQEELTHRGLGNHVRCFTMTGNTQATASAPLYFQSSPLPIVQDASQAF